MSLLGRCINRRSLDGSGSSSCRRRRIFYTSSNPRSGNLCHDLPSTSSLLFSSLTQTSTRVHVPILTRLGASTGIKLCRPFLLQLAASTVKTSAADLLIQTVIEKKSLRDIDWRRNAIFAGFGFAYLGGFQYWLLITKYKQWFPTMKRFSALPFHEKLKCRQGLWEGCKMVVFDVVVHSPMIYFPTYYSLKEFVGGSSWNPRDWVEQGLGKYAKNAKDDLSAMVVVTIPSDICQVLLPLHLKMLFRHFVSFFWTAYVSFSRGALDDDDEEDADGSNVTVGNKRQKEEAKRAYHVPIEISRCL